eukprot:9573854-Alexandrium_andersonii.AAC.1
MWPHGSASCARQKPHISRPDMGMLKEDALTSATAGERLRIGRALASSRRTRGTASDGRK